MNRGELNAQIKLEMEIDPAIVSDAERYRYINRGIDDIASLGIFENVADLEASSNPVQLPDDYIALIDAFRVDGINLIKLTPVSSLRQGTGLPYGYLIVDKSMYLVPFQPCDIRLIYTHRPHYISEEEGVEHDASVPGLPEDWHPLLVTFAVALCHLKSGSIARYTQYLDAYQGRKAMKTMEYMRSYNTPVRTIRQAHMKYTPEV